MSAEGSLSHPDKPIPEKNTNNLCYIGLGSNLDTPTRHIEQAIQTLKTDPSTQAIRVSPLYTNSAIGPGEQPDYVNGVAELITTHSPQSLLTWLQAIEADHGRQRTNEQWSARPLDLDILLFNQLQLATASLTIPHPRLHERSFVVGPLLDLNPNLTLPDGTPLEHYSTVLAAHPLHVLAQP